MNFWEIENVTDFRNLAKSYFRDEKSDTGIQEITLTDWRLIDSLLYTMIDMSHAIFRGVESKKYKLTPSIFREWGFSHEESVESKNEYI